MQRSLLTGVSAGRNRLSLIDCASEKMAWMGGASLRNGRVGICEVHPLQRREGLKGPPLLGWGRKGNNKGRPPANGAELLELLAETVDTTPMLF